MSVGDDAECGNGVGDEHAPQRDAPFAAGVVQSRLGRQQNPVAHVPDQARQVRAGANPKK